MSFEGDRRSFAEERSPQVFLQTEFDEFHPDFSPNGRFLAYESSETGQYEIYARPFPPSSGKIKVSEGGGQYPRWNPNGRELFYRDGDRLMSVDADIDGDLVFGRPRFLFEWPHITSSRDYDVSPDGERLVMAEDTESTAAITQLFLVQNFSEELKRLVPAEN